MSVDERAPRRVKHVSRACDNCRRRRTKCDGNAPSCGYCIKRGWECGYFDEDKRKIGNEVNELRNRLTRLENALSFGSYSKSPSTPVQSESQPILTGCSPTDASPPNPEAEASSFYISEAHAGPSTREKRPLSELADASILQGKIRVEKRTRRRTGNHFGPISIWSQVATNEDFAPPSRSPSPEPMTWSTNLPPNLRIDEEIHDAALERFAAYYSPWCMVADMPSLMSALREPSLPRPRYSPLLHCTSLFLGLCLLRPEGLGSASDIWSLFHSHCLWLLQQETGNMSTETVLALNLLASCQHFAPEMAYLYFGMAVAAVQTLGLGHQFDFPRKHRQYSVEEQGTRESTLWAIYLQDILRAVGVGRNPLIPASYGNNLPRIIASVDAVPWALPRDIWPTAPPRVRDLSGLPSTSSTVLHWTARLGVILRGVIDALYSAKTTESNRSAPPPSLVRRLESWNKQVPLPDPTARPLPHILTMHLLYHLICIYLYRPFYRTGAACGQTPPSAVRCHQAANESLQLLKLYDDLHGIENAPMTLIQVSFGTATVFLFEAVGNSNAPSSVAREGVEFCTNLLRRQMNTWRTADDPVENALSALLRLRSEYLSVVDAPPAAAETTQDADDFWNAINQFPFTNLDFFLTSDWTIDNVSL